MQKEPLTEYGYNKLTREFKDLKDVQRPQIVQEIEIARSYGDLKENAEYHAAKEKQAFIEARIAELSDMISRAQVIDPSKLEHKKISFGSTILLCDTNTDDEIEYTIVGAVESNPDKRLISYHSPLAKQLVGKAEGDEVSVKLPSGTKDYEILKVYYKEVKYED